MIGYVLLLLQDHARLRDAERLTTQGQDSAREFSTATTEAALSPSIASDPAPSSALAVTEAVSSAVLACLSLEAALAALCIREKDSAVPGQSQPPGAGPQQSDGIDKPPAKPASAFSQFGVQPAVV